MFLGSTATIASEPQTRVSSGEQGGQVVTIQYLRAAAALGVLLSHACGFRTGAAGVDVFFVVSGFIMVGSASRREWRVGRFALHRAIRIAPLYWLITLALAAMALLAPALFSRMRPHPTHILASLLFVPHMDNSGRAWPLLVQGWSLNLEVMFYVVFAASLALRRWRMGFLAAVLMSLALSSLFVPRGTAWARTYCNPMFLEFLGGIVLGRFWLAGKLAGRRAALAMIAAAVASFAATCLLHADLASALPRRPEWMRVLVWGVPSVMLTAGALSLEHRRRMRQAPVLMLLGEASYSLYLVQGLVISALAKLTGHRSPLLTVPIALMAALAVHLLIEQPATRRLRAWTHART